MKVHWRHWCAASIAVHAAMMGALSTAARPSRVRSSARAPARVVTVPVDFAPAAPPALAPSSAEHFGPLVGSSLGMRSLFAILERTAPTATTYSTLAISTSVTVGGAEGRVVTISSTLGGARGWLGR